ncbi:MAG: hypothetical protein BWZ02_00526 [Lentisphaerae bacterium ADurb.BinA184]|nr:MAG: hypothetical protein BWZ02_00526 [Lentisphaerae bacterium ADurb.BinA184]
MNNCPRPRFTSRCARGFLLTLAWTAVLGLSSRSAPGATDGKLRVLTVTGDWKSQAWYQDVWMPAPGQPPKLYRGRFIAAKVNEAAPGKFEFTDITNYIGQEYLDAAYLSQFDVVLLGDIVGWSLNPRFQAAVGDYVRNGGGLIYCASWKWHCAMQKNTPFADVLPAEFPADNLTGDWKTADTTTDTKEFVPIPANPEHPVMQGLDWTQAPALARNFRLIPKPDSDVLIKTPGGAPVVVAWQHGKGRAMITGSIFANDELSDKFGDGWRDIGQFYAQAFAWLGANSANTRAALKEATAEIAVEVDFGKALNRVPPAIFSVHGHDSPGFDPLQGLALENFRALNPRGGFARFAANCAPERGRYDFKGVDHQLTNIKRLELEPLALFGAYGYGQPKWLWADGSSWSNPSPQAIQDIKDEITAFLEHTNGRKGDPDYKQTVTYIELCNEPDINYQTVAGYARLFNAVAQHVHENFPGVKIGTYGSYEVPYLKAFIDACGGHADWISRHPYGWTGEMLFKAQDDFAAYAAGKGHGHLQFIITEWDFWIMGREKFDYMVKRYFEAVKRENLAGTLHYRLGMYNEPIYLFGILWGGWGQDKGAGQPNTPMHDAYDAFWIFRDFRGERVATTRRAPGSEGLLGHVLADATRNGDKLNAVLYYDWAYDGTGYKDYKAGVNYGTVRAQITLAFPPAGKERRLALSRATGTGFEVVRKDVKIAPGQSEYRDTLEMPPLTAWSLVVE